jgi:hypothetical protein
MQSNDSTVIGPVLKGLKIESTPRKYSERKGNMVALESIEQTFNGSVDYGKKVSCKRMGETATGSNQ